MGFIRRHRVVVVLVALGAVVTLLVAQRIRRQQAAAVPRRQIEVVVGVAKPVRKDLDVKLAYTADVLPNQQVAIFSKVSGYIKRLGADLGDFVKKDQLLVEIEAPELSAAVEQARAAVATAEANLKVAESTLESTKANAANQEANLVKARAVAMNDSRNAARLLPGLLRLGPHGRRAQVAPGRAPRALSPGPRRRRRPASRPRRSAGR